MKPLVGPILAFGALLATLASATLPPFDFTGSWSGSATSKGASVPMSATLTSTGPKTFTGSVTLETVTTCQVDGTYGKRVKLRATCPDGSSTILAHLSRTTETLHGSFSVHHHTQRVKFTLTKSA
jgi:hypothetical protein